MHRDNRVNLLIGGVEKSRIKRRITPKAPPHSLHGFARDDHRPECDDDGTRDETESAWVNPHAHTRQRADADRDYGCAYRRAHFLPERRGPQPDDDTSFRFAHDQPCAGDDRLIRQAVRLDVARLGT